MGKNTKEIRFVHVIMVVCVIAMIITCATYGGLVYNNVNQAQQTGEVLLGQMCSLIEKNQAAEANMLVSLKDEYIIRANVVAYMLENHEDAEYDRNKLNKIAKLLSIDEIHLFDANGVIYSGTEPKYYGLSFDSGEQMAYFKPMLSNRKLAMCQDVTPNTAEEKEMMYAIAWDSKGQKMVQVGIEPIRLINELKRNEMSNVVNSMPIFENLDIYVADGETEEIIGATDKTEGMTLRQIGMDCSGIDKFTICHMNTAINGRESVCSILKYENYVICIAQSRSGIRKECILPASMILGCLVLATVILLWVYKRLIRIQKEQMEQLMILTTMSEIYYSMHILDLAENSIVEYSAQNQVHDIVQEYGQKDAIEVVQKIMHETMSEEYLERGLQFTDLTTLADRLSDKQTIYQELIGKNVGWIRMAFVVLSRDEDGRARKVICTTQIIDEEKRKEEKLIRDCVTDNLTHCYNRRAYESDLLSYADTPPEQDFVYVSMDVNGLKTVNDMNGHAAGDELLLGAADCMRKCFSSYGRVYRLGGDEFVAMITVERKQLDKIREEFESMMKNWTGELVNALSVSCGYVTKREYPDLTVGEMEKEADKKMYEAKSRYYKESGIDRRKR